MSVPAGALGHTILTNDNFAGNFGFAEVATLYGREHKPGHACTTSVQTRQYTALLSLGSMEAL
jgi:hypothetical protein